MKKFKKEIYPKYKKFLQKKNLKIEEVNKKRKKDFDKEIKKINFNKTLKKKVNYKGEDNFLSRQDNFEKMRAEKIAKNSFIKLREKNLEIDSLTFKPSINNKLVYKRSVNDMLLWKKKSNLKKEKERKKKQRVK